MSDADSLEGDEGSTPRLLRSSAAVAVCTGLSRLTGMARVIVLAAVLGRDVLSDSYNLANTTPNIVYELLIGGVLSATLVPLFVEANRNHDDDGPSALFSVGLTAVFVVTLAAIVASPLLAHLYAGGVSGEHRTEELHLLVPFLELLLPQIFFYGISTLAEAALNARRRFIAAAFTPVLNNIIVIATAIVLEVGFSGRKQGLLTTLADNRGAQIVLGVGTTAGIAAMAVPLIFTMRAADIRVHWNFDWRNPIIARVIRLSGWTIGYVIANQIALLIVLRLANSGHSGTVTAYQNAFIYFQLPHGLIAVTLMTTFLPELAHAWVGRDLDALRARFLQAVRLLLVFTIPAAVGYMLLGRDITRVLLSHGRYTVADANLTGDTLIAFAAGLIGYSTYLLTLNVFYAMKDTKTPFKANLIENGTNIVLALLLFHAGSVGLAGAYAGAYLVAAIAALWLLDRRIGGLRGPELGRFGQQVLRIIGATAAMAVVVELIHVITPSGTAGAWLSLLIAAPAGAVTYGVAAMWLGLDGVADAWRAIRRRVPGLRG